MSAQITIPRRGVGPLQGGPRAELRTSSAPKALVGILHVFWVTLRNSGLAHGTNVKPHLTVLLSPCPTLPKATKQHCQILHHTPLLQVLKIPSRLALEGALQEGNLQSMQNSSPHPGFRKPGNSSESHSVVSDSLPPHGLYSPWNSPGQNTGVGSRSLCQGIFPTQGLNPGLPHCGQILCQQSHQGKAKNTGESSLSLLQCIFPNSGIKPGSLALQADSLPTELRGKPKQFTKYWNFSWSLHMKNQYLLIKKSLPRISKGY